MDNCFPELFPACSPAHTRLLIRIGMQYLKTAFSSFDSFKCLIDLKLEDSSVDRHSFFVDLLFSHYKQK